MEYDNNNNNKRIAKNTFMLYVRMLLIMAVTLYTSRIVLNILGVEDFGIYNVVGGVIILFAFITGAMSSATQRYLNYELGKGDFDKLKTVFSTSIFIHFILSLIILIVGETVGLWFLENKMVIPENRIHAAFWVYQISVLSCIINIISIPYNAAIIAREKMNIFAYISIFEAFAKLFTIYLLKLVTADRLIYYAIFICIVQLIIRVIYGWYCKRNLQETRLVFLWDKKLFYSMLSFSGWNIFGNIAGVGMSQGTNILLNMFFGPGVNAAKGISTQVQTAVHSFCTNFQMAINPQIYKTYASGDIKQAHKLIFISSRLSLYLILIFSLPIMLETKQILHIWLQTVPDYSEIFVQLTLVISMFQALASPLITGNAATGNIRKLMTTVAFINWCVVPFAYICLKIGAAPQSVFWTQIGVMFMAHIARIKIVGNVLKFSFIDYCNESLYQIILVSIMSFIPVYLLKSNMDESVLRLLLVILLSVISVVSMCFFIGINSDERKMVKKFIINKLKK
jgi:O-antigen/teichoic acid export membrane protein